MSLRQDVANNLDALVPANSLTATKKPIFQEIDELVSMLDRYNSYTFFSKYSTFFKIFCCIGIPYILILCSAEIAVYCLGLLREHSELNKIASAYDAAYTVERRIRDYNNTACGAKYPIKSLTPDSLLHIYPMHQDMLSYFAVRSCEGQYRKFKYDRSDEAEAVISLKFINHEILLLVSTLILSLVSFISVIISIACFFTHHSHVRDLKKESSNHLKLFGSNKNILINDSDRIKSVKNKLRQFKLSDYAKMEFLLEQRASANSYMRHIDPAVADKIFSYYAGDSKYVKGR